MFRVPNADNPEVSASVVEPTSEPERALALTGSAGANQNPRLGFRAFPTPNGLPEWITFGNRSTTVCGKWMVPQQLSVHFNAAMKQSFRSSLSHLGFLGGEKAGYKCNNK